MAFMEQNANYRPEKIEHQKIKMDNGHTSMYSYEQRKVITVAFEQDIGVELFTTCKVQYRAFDKTLISKIPTLFKILNKAEEVGVPKNRLHNVLDCYIKLCEPELEGLISLDVSCV